VAGALVALSPGCGPSALSQAYDGYKAKVEPMLEREDERWNRLAKFADGIGDGRPPPAYYDFLERDALPFYVQLHDTVEGIEVPHAGLRRTHDQLLRFSEARLRLIHTEVASKELNAALADPETGLGPWTDSARRSEQSAARYLAAVGAEVPDSKWSALDQTIQGFERDWFQALRAGEKDGEEVGAHLLSHVLPKLKELRNREYEDDEAGRALKLSVALAHETYELLAERIDLVAAAMAIRVESDKAVRDSTESKKDFLVELEAVRRGM
jgi:hypothetical protein